MEDFHLNNRTFTQIMKKSKLEMPFSDFDEVVMHRIRREANQTEGFSRDIKLSFFFFLLGTSLGLVINFFLQQLLSTFLGISADNVLLIFQLSFVLLFLTQLESLVKLLKKF